MLKEMHVGILGDHLGEDKTLACLHEKFYSLGYHNDVKHVLIVQLSKQILPKIDPPKGV